VGGEEYSTLYVEVRNRNVIMSDEYLGEAKINIAEIGDVAPSDVWLKLFDQSKNKETDIQLHLKVLLRQKMDETSEIEDMCMRLEALIEEEKQTQESLKQHALRHSEDSDFEWKFKTSKRRLKALQNQISELKKRKEKFHQKAQQKFQAKKSNSGGKKGKLR
jgi:chaperonin cofactor prefoldin